MLSNPILLPRYPRDPSLGNQWYISLLHCPVLDYDDLSQYIIANLGMAQQFGTIDADIDTVFPATMEVDYIRIYQHKDRINVGCDPKDYPTRAYIEA